MFTQISGIKGIVMGQEWMQMLLTKMCLIEILLKFAIFIKEGLKITLKCEINIHHSVFIDSNGYTVYQRLCKSVYTKVAGMLPSVMESRDGQQGSQGGRSMLIRRQGSKG